VIFEQCSICHNNAKDAPAKVGPNLYGIVNRGIAKDSSYQGRYSAALQGISGSWSVDNISLFIESPQTFAKGTYMGFAGLSNGVNRADLIAFLNSQSDSPIEYQLKEPASTDTAKQTPANIGKLFRAPGAQKTFMYCSACHSERIVTQQGLTKSDWQELLEWMVDEQGMDEISEPDYTTVINYLSTNYGIDRPNFPNNK
jgi:cytochrome c